MPSTRDPRTPLVELIPEMTRQSRIEAVTMSDYLKALPEKDWLNRSFCTDWTIKDVAEHQAGWGLALRDAARSSLENQELMDFSEQTMQRYQDQLFDLNRLELADLITSTTDEMVELLAQASPEQLKKPINSRFGPMNLLSVGLMRLEELSLHSWDVRVVNDLTASVSRESLPLTVPILIEFLWFFAHKPMVETTSPKLTYQFEIKGPVHGPVAMTLKDGKVEVLCDYADNPDVQLKLSTEEFLRLAWGRLRVGWMLDDGWLKFEGDKAAAHKLAQLFQGTQDYK